MSVPYFGFRGWWSKPREPLPLPTITRASPPTPGFWEGRYFDAYDVEVEVDIPDPTSVFPLAETIDILAVRYGAKAKDAELLYVYRESLQVREWRLEEAPPAFDLSPISYPPHPDANPALRGSVILFPEPLTKNQVPRLYGLRLGMMFYFTVTKEPPWERRRY